MPNRDLNTSRIPEPYRAAYVDFASALRRLAADNLLGLSAFGGWLLEDPFYAGSPARSVAVLRQIDLEMLDRLASQGERLGRRRMSAPLVMTPAYIRASCDTFPLELLEIRELHTVVVGTDHFDGLTVPRRDLRLQCERELKTELLQLRQGLLSAAGRHKMLPDLCLTVLERVIRTLRGLLHLLDAPMPRTARELVARAAEATRVRLDTCQRLAAGETVVALQGFRQVYGEIEALSGFVDQMPGVA